jgi:hypothetical protein
MKPKINRAGDHYVPQGYDACQTPPAALNPLLPYLSRDKIIWESAAGERLLVERLVAEGYRVEESELLRGQNYFDYQPAEWDIQVTNPPYSIKHLWMRRAYELGKPFALLMPIEAVGTQRFQVLIKEFGAEIMLLNRRVNFKMPVKGWKGSQAQFPVAWYTWQLNLGSPLVFADW